MSLVQGIRNSLSNNRGKIGLAAGVGSTIAAQNYIKENPALVNQAEYNIMAKGNNLLSPVTGKQEISQGIQDNVNGYYNHLQENPKNILGINRPVLQGEDAYNLSQGVQTFTNNVKDFPKSVQDVFENQTMIVPIKDMILEGYSYEEILEAINAKKVAAAADKKLTKIETKKLNKIDKKNDKTQAKYTAKSEKALAAGNTKKAKKVMARAYDIQVARYANKLSMQKSFRDNFKVKKLQEDLINKKVLDKSLNHLLGGPANVWAQQTSRRREKENAAYAKPIADKHVKERYN